MNLFEELIQVAIGQREELSCIPSEEEWHYLFEMSKTQTVAGVLFPALDVLYSHGQKPPKDLLYEWIDLSEHIMKRNRLLDERCVELECLFREGGFNTCILKGQVNAQMYPNPQLRTPGDIDLWVFGFTSNIKKTEGLLHNDIVRFCQSKAKISDNGGYHFKFPIYEDVIVEIHFTPSYTRVPRFVKQTDCFFKQKPEIVKVNGLNASSVNFNIVYQLSHMMRHFFYGGIGLRQMMDYFYLLKYKTKEDRINVKETIHYLGLDKFAGAVMWVLNEVFNLENKYMIASPDMKKGELLLAEIMKSGNFGKYDKRFSSRILSKSRTLSTIIRNMNMIRQFPEESFCFPIYGAWKYLKARKVN